MISQELESKLEKYIQSCGCELYDITLTKEYNQDVLRISIYRKDGISHAHCQEVSNLISPLLDVEDPFASKYLLEVSSPGVERTLKTPRHFRLSIGEEVQVKLLDKTLLEGTIENANAESFWLQTSQGSEEFPYSQTKKVKTLLRW